jgi:hypothetical protein
MPSQPSHPWDVFFEFWFFHFFCVGSYWMNVNGCNNPTQLFEVDDWMNEFVKCSGPTLMDEINPAKRKWVDEWILWNKTLWIKGHLKIHGCIYDETMRCCDAQWTKCYGNLRDYLRWLDECDYVKKTSMDEIVHCDELWCTIMNESGTITTFAMFNQSCKNGWLWWCR